MTNNLTGSNTEQPELGKLLGVYHIKFFPGWLLPGVLLVFPLLGLVMIVGVDTVFKKILSLVFFMITTAPIVFVLWKLLPKIRDELKIYEKGFTYKSLKGLQRCRWSEIKDGSFSQKSNGQDIVNAFVKKNGEEITFVYNMQGLDKLNSLYDDEVYRQVNEEEKKSVIELPATHRVKNEIRELGELQKIYHVTYGCSEIVMHGLLLLPVAFFTIGVFVSKDLVCSLILVIPFAALFFGMLWSTFQDRNDELSIFQNGLTYRSRKKGLQTCFWNEIAETRGSRWNGVISDIKTQNGEWINFANAMQGLEDLTTRRRWSIDGLE